MNEQYVKRLDRLIERNAGNFLDSEKIKLKTLRDMLLKISDPAVPTHELHYRDLIQVPYVSAKLNGPDHAEFNDLFAEVRQHMESLGYRQDILNLNEHMLKKSSLHGDNLDSKPYLVRGIVHSQLTLEEAKCARQLEKFFLAYGDFFNIKEETVKASLEPLDENGYTLRNPRLVEVVDSEVRPLPTTYNVTFPFLRPERMNLDYILEAVQTSQEKSLSSVPFTFALFQGPEGLGYVFTSLDDSQDYAYHSFLSTTQEMGINSSQYLHAGGGQFFAEAVVGKAPHLSIMKHDASPVQLDEKLLAKTLNQMQILEPGKFTWSFRDSHK